MKTWAAMYGIIWLAFFEIISVLFLHLGAVIDSAVHIVLGASVLAFAFLIYRRVRKTPCPERIKAITKATWYFAVLQAVLGVALAVETYLSLGGLYTGVLSFVHLGIALTIITQASSSATSFDMWEEKEFITVPSK